MAKVSRQAKCPFYCAETPQSVCCTALLDNITALKVSFTNPESSSEHKRAYCYNINGFVKCEAYKGLVREYLRQEE